jgi:hypothetical protein
MRVDGMKSKRYRIFVEDVGPGLFSAAGTPELKAQSPEIAILAGMGAPRWCGRLLIALPVDRKDLWPNGATGEVPEEALEYCVKERVL